LSPLAASGHRDVAQGEIIERAGWSAASSDASNQNFRTLMLAGRWSALGGDGAGRATL